MTLPPETAPGTPADDPIPPRSPYQLASASGVDPGLFAGPPAPPSLDPESSELSPWPVAGPSSDPLPASLGRRSGAFLLDFFLTFVAVVLTSALGFAFGPFGVLGVPVAAIALNTVGVWLAGGTLAQRMLGLRVVDRETGEGIKLPRTLLRTAIIISPLLVLAAATFSPILSLLGNYSSASTLIWLPALAWLTMFVVAGATGRSLHDRAARSVVVRLA